MPPGSMAIFENRKPFHNEKETISTGDSSSYVGISHSGRAVQTQPGFEGHEPRGPLSNVILWMRHSAANTCSQILQATALSSVLHGARLTVSRQLLTLSVTRDLLCSEDVSVTHLGIPGPAWKWVSPVCR